MANKSYQDETRETAYQTWRDCGQNYQFTLKELKKKGFIISAPTLYDWAEKYTWKDRAARAETEERKAKDINISFDEKLLADMTKQKERYDRYLEGLGDMKTDVNALNGYINLCKTISDVRSKTGAFKAALFIDFMKDLIDWLSKNDPGAVAVIEGIFDDFVKYAREKYAA